MEHGRLITVSVYSIAKKESGMSEGKIAKGERERARKKENPI